LLTRFLDCRWLLILDNADDLEIVQQIWPTTGAGSILLTSRDFGSASNPASAGFHVQPFDETTGAVTLLRILGRDEHNTQERKLASEIVTILGGLPLAINQIASFIKQRKLQLKDLPPLYDKNASKVDDKKSRLTRYEKTLGNVWELSLSKLSTDAAHLHGLLVFFSPDVIDEAMLIDGGSAITDEDFTFLTDHIE
jgi:NB-ARC domain